jgi:flagellar hook assembly protein FlgD
MVSWDGKNANGKDCPNGEYYYVITHENKSDHKKSGALFLSR